MRNDHGGIVLERVEVVAEGPKIRGTLRDFFGQAWKAAWCLAGSPVGAGGGGNRLTDSPISRAPLVEVPVDAACTQEHGRAGLVAIERKAAKFLARLNWYTIEFCLVRTAVKLPKNRRFSCREEVPGEFFPGLPKDSCRGLPALTPLD